MIKGLTVWLGLKITKKNVVAGFIIPPSGNTALFMGFLASAKWKEYELMIENAKPPEIDYHQTVKNGYDEDIAVYAFPTWVPRKIVEEMTKESQEVLRTITIAPTSNKK